MYILKLIGKNALRHRLRTALTFFGIVVATIAFGLLQTVVDAWYAGAEGASNARVVTRNSISLIFPLPLTYESKIRAVDGVSAVSYANWFGGVYQEPKNFFPQFAISGKSYLDLYPEFVLQEAQRSAFLRDRKGALVGRKLALAYGFRVGDSIPIKGTIYPGSWEFVIRGVFDARDNKTDTAQMFFHWDYLNETLKRTAPRRANQVGVYIVQIKNPDRAAEITRAIDGQFTNSLAETLSETEKAFQLGFVAMTETIVVAIRAVSFVVIIIIMAVMANTMAMTARERLTEYATLKAMGFGTRFLALVIFGESLLISLAAAGVGIVLTFPVAAAFAQRMGTLFPIFQISARTLWLQLAAALAIGLTAAILPTRRAVTVPIVEGLRRG